MRGLKVRLLVAISLALRAAASNPVKRAGIAEIGDSVSANYGGHGYPTLPPSPPQSEAATEASATYVPEQCTCTSGVQPNTPCAGIRLTEQSECTLLCPSSNNAYFPYVNTGQGGEGNHSKWIGTCVQLVADKYIPSLFFVTYHNQVRMLQRLLYQDNDISTNAASMFNHGTARTFPMQGSQNNAENGQAVHWSILNSERKFAVIQDLVPGDGSPKATAARVQVIKATVCRQQNKTAVCAEKKIVVGCQIANCKIGWTPYGNEPPSCMGTCTEDYAAKGKCQTRHVGSPHAMGVGSNNYVWQEGALNTRTDTCSTRTHEYAIMLS